MFSLYLLCLTVATVSAKAGRPVPRSLHAPAWWLREAMCIHSHESTDWHKRTDWLGRPSRDHGGMQIDTSTWASYVPRGFPSDPADASPREQLIVAYRIWQANGRRWGNGQWPYSSRQCGLR